MQGTNSTIKTTLLLGAPTGLFLVIGSAIGGTGGMMIAFILAVALNMGVLMIFLAPFAALLIQLAISRSREFSADANALEKLETHSLQAIPVRVNPSTAHLYIVNPLHGVWQICFALTQKQKSVLSGCEP